MDIELIDRTWACLPKEFKEKVKKKYARCVKIDEDDNPNLPAYAVKSAITRRALLEKLFGEHNLTSDTEEEEMLTVPRKKVEEKWQRAYEQEAKYSRAQDSSVARLELYYNRGILSILDTLFGSKCLPDELNEDNFAKSEPKPSEPKFKMGDELALDKRIVVKVDEVFADGKYLVYSRIGNIYMVKESDLKPYTEPVGTKDDTKGNTKDPTFTDDCKSQCKSPDRLRIAAMAMEGILSKGELADPDEVTDMALIYADELIKKCEEGSTL